MKKVIQDISIFLTALGLIGFLYGSINLARIEAQEISVKMRYDVPNIAMVDLIAPIVKKVIVDPIVERAYDILLPIGEKLAQPIIPYMPIIPYISEDVGYIMPDSNNPFYGTYSASMTFKNGTTGKIYKIIHPRMYRVTLQSEWELAPDLQDLVVQALS